MTTLLFIDTNIWLDFYRSNNEAGLSLLNRCKELSKFIIVTDQVEMEFSKNRQEVILGSMKTLPIPQDISIPAFLTSDEVNDLGKKMQEALRLVKKIKSRLPQILEDPESNDHVYQICHEIFRKADGLRFGQHHCDWKEIQEAAETRYRLGYPPRKSSDTSMGDAVNWEWIIHCSKSSKANIAIVSRDGDYGRFSEEKGYLNDHLRREFSDRVGKERKISLHQKLTAVLKQFKVIVPEKEQQEENRIIQSAERANTNMGLFSNNALAWYAAVANSPAALLAEAVAKYQANQKSFMAAIAASSTINLDQEAAKTLASQQAALDSIAGASKTSAWLQEMANQLGTGGPTLDGEIKSQDINKEDAG